MLALNGLAASKPTNGWAAAVLRQIRALGAAVADGSYEANGILQRLAELNRQAPELAEKIADRERELARQLVRTNFALSRRLDMWQELVRLGVAQVKTVPSPERLAMCVAKVEGLTRDSAQGQLWREYLLVDALRESSHRPPSEQDYTTQQLARRVLERIAQTRLTPPQQKFIASGPVAALRDELRHWVAESTGAAESIGAAKVLQDIETYERRSLPSDARQLALDYQQLTVSPVDGRRRLAERVAWHYRYANVRIAVTEELLNKLMPTRNLEYAPVEDTVLNRPVRGESVMETKVAIRMLPNPERVRMALEVAGSISSLTTTDAGPARFHNDSQSYYVARKPLEIDMNGISIWPVEVDVQNETRVRGLETDFDRVPLVNMVARGVAKSQMAQELLGGIAGSEAEGGRQGQPARRRGNPRRPDQGRSLHERARIRPVERAVAGPAIGEGRNDAEALRDGAPLGRRGPVGEPHAPPPGVGRQPGERADPRVGAQQRHPALATGRPEVHVARTVAANRRPAEPASVLGHQSQIRQGDNHLRQEGCGGGAMRQAAWRSGRALDADLVDRRTVQARAEAVEEFPDRGILFSGEAGTRGADWSVATSKSNQE